MVKPLRAWIRNILALRIENVLRFQKRRKAISATMVKVRPQWPPASPKLAAMKYCARKT